MLFTSIAPELTLFPVSTMPFGVVWMCEEDVVAVWIYCADDAAVGAKQWLKPASVNSDNAVAATIMMLFSKGVSHTIAPMFVSVVVV
jgi:hypothetical protein